MCVCDGAPGHERSQQVRAASYKLPASAPLYDRTEGNKKIIHSVCFNDFRHSKHLGEQLADLHLHNKRQMEKLNKEQQTVGNNKTSSNTTLNSSYISNFK